MGDDPPTFVGETSAPLNQDGTEAGGRGGTWKTPSTSYAREPASCLRNGQDFPARFIDRKGGVWTYLATVDPWPTDTHHQFLFLLLP